MIACAWLYASLVLTGLRDAVSLMGVCTSIFSQQELALHKHATSERTQLCSSSRRAWGSSATASGRGSRNAAASKPSTPPSNKAAKRLYVRSCGTHIESSDLNTTPVD